MSLLSVSNSSTYLRSRRVLTDFGGVATQDSRRMTMEAAAQARLRRLVRAWVMNWMCIMKGFASAAHISSTYHSPTAAW